MVPTADLQPNPDQPRRSFNGEKLLELAQSLRENGMLQPVTITMHSGAPVLVAGERRWRAAKLAGLKEIPCIVAEARGAQSALLALIENLQREDMNCFEEAEGFRRLIQVYGLTQEEAAQRLGCTQPTVANKLRLLRLPPEQRERLIGAELSERHARALLRVPNDEQRAVLLNRVISERLTVADTERLIDRHTEEPPKRRRPTPLVRDVRLFLNTVSHAVDTMRRSGIDAHAERSETEDYIEYMVRIPKGDSVDGRKLTVHTA